jgi:hypothetical protein
MLEFFSEGGRRRVVLFEIDELIESEQLGLRKANEIALGRKTTMECGETQQRESGHNIASALQGHRLRRPGHWSSHSVVPPVEKSNGMAGRISPSERSRRIREITWQQAPKHYSNDVVPLADFARRGGIHTDGRYSMTVPQLAPRQEGADFSPRSRSMPSLTIKTSRRTFCCGHPFNRLMSDR